MIQEYVVGFLFNPEMDKVVLIEKTHPDWQKGFLNGVGGKVEQDEGAHSCMKREFKEETGLESNDWRFYFAIYGKSWKCYFFYNISEDFDKVKSITEEQIKIVGVKELWNVPVIQNLRWLIPMCLDGAHKLGESESK